MSKACLQRVLYAEDEPDIREIAGIALELVGGLTLCSCASGRAALAEAERFRPDLILLDVMMPEMDGPATLAALRRIPALATTPVIFMTAKAQASEVARYRALGALDVIAKPFQPLLLADQLRAIWLGPVSGQPGAGLPD
jgi:CheY-like chemotaxis protein